MQLQKDAKRYKIFEKSYWNYFLELEDQFLATKRYVAFDAANFKAYSLEYLKLLEAVCSEIDIVGKEIAHQIDPGFKISDHSSNIQKWWFTIQDWYAENAMEPVKILDELEFCPWEGYRIEEYEESIKYMMAVFLQKTDEVTIADRYWDALKSFLEDCRKEIA